MIGVFTHTRWLNQDWLMQCSASVRAALPADGEHVVCEMRGSYTEARFEALRAFPYVAFVDDDDLVHPEAIHACIEALETTGAGIAFTLQELIDEHGSPKGVSRPARDYLDVAMAPIALHHFALIRRAAVDDEALRAAIQHGIGIDWLMKANAALRHGAVHVPIVGYQWRQYEGQDSRVRAAQFNSTMPNIRKTTLSWMRGNARIPRHTLQ